jgi:hypothetical protein
MMRTVWTQQSLSGCWKLLPDLGNGGREERWFSGIPQEAVEAPVPGIIQQVWPAYHGAAWYWLQFTPEVEAGPAERCVLCFAAVDYAAQVWLNGADLGGHEGGETPFQLDATGALRAGTTNLLAVRVANPGNEPLDGMVLKEIPHRNKVIPYSVGSSFAQGGVVGPVELRVVPSVRITDVFARPDPRNGTLSIRASLQNDLGRPVDCRLCTTAGPAAHSGSSVVSRSGSAICVDTGESRIEVGLQVPQPRLWSPQDPFLYRLDVRLEASDDILGTMESTWSARFGFRELRVERGFFRLNGKRVFLRSTHTGNHYPIGQQVPVDPDHLRRDLVNAKAAGFNMVRFIAGVAYPEQLDLCDELGLMVYEECYASWCLADSPHMAERFDRSTLEMVRRDRNHPSVVIWGLLNETPDGPVFRHAVSSLPRLRALDDTRLVLLGSGRWDCQWSIGSVSNPWTSEWQHAWGSEAPDAPAAPYSWTLGYPGGYFEGAGDAHVYPRVPQTPETNRFLRSLGQGTRPVFLSEYGIGSLLNVVRETRRFEQARARSDLEDAALMRAMADKLAADWERFGMGDVYPFLEDMLRDSQRLHARQRLLGFDLIRANPQIAGYNLTGMLDHGMTGEGLWTFWREWKPGIVDALQDGWAPLRWCLFVGPLHGYVGQSCRLEAVLANENVLAPGDYPARFRVSGPGGTLWEGRLEVHVPTPQTGEDGPLAIPVLCEEVNLNGSPGTYEFAASMEQGGAPAGGRLRFRLSESVAQAHPRTKVTLWAVEPHVERWLKDHGMPTRHFEEPVPDSREVILVGEPANGPGSPAAWRELARRMARGAVVLFLSPTAFRRGDNPVAWLPLASKGRCYAFNDWLYHKECVAKLHPIFEGLQAKGIMDWDYYGEVIPHYLFDGQDTPEEVIAAAFAVSYPCPGGYASGVLLGAYRFGAGRFFVNSLRVLENVGLHPAADRLLLNSISYARRFVDQPIALLPEGFEGRLRAIGYQA